MSEILTQKRLKDLLSYNPESGLFTRLNKKQSPIGKTKDRYGHLNITVDGKRYKAHRLAWLYLYGEFPIGFIDHINGVSDDNRCVNLRVVTNTQNLQNQKIRSTNTSGYKGVSWNKQRLKWKAECCANYITTVIGYFDTPEEASKAYNAFAKVAHGAFYRDTLS